MKLPGKPVKAPNVGGSETWGTITSKWDFGVEVLPLPPDKVPDASMQNLFLDGGLQGLTASYGATVKSTAPITINGFPGREVEFSIPPRVSPTSGRKEPQSTAVLRFYLVNNKLVIPRVRCAGTITKDSPDVKTFFDSFKLNASATSSTADLAGPPGGMPGGRPGMNDPAQTAAAAGAVPGGFPGANPNALPNSTPAPGFNADGTRTAGFAPPAPAATETAASSSLPNSTLPASGTTALPNSTPAMATATASLPMTQRKGFTQPSDTTSAAAAEPPQDEPAKLPQTKSSGFTNANEANPFQPKTAGSSAAKSRSNGVANPATYEPKVEKVKSTGLVSLDGASVDDLLKVVGKKNEHRKVLAAEKLRDHSEAGPNPEVALKIADLLKSSDELIVRAAIAQALEKWACPEIHEAVVKNLAGSTTEVRQSMIRIMAASNGPDSPDKIANCLADKDDRKVATEALISMGETAEGAVIKMLNHRDSKVKTAACEILKEIGSADSIAALTKATKEWTGTERLAARKALKALEAKK